MSQKLLRQLSKITEEIENERFGDIDFSIFLPGAERPPQRDPDAVRRRTDRHHASLILLYGKKIHVLLQLADCGDIRYGRSLQDDFAQLVESVKVLTYAWEINGDVICDAYDLLGLISFRDMKSLQKYLPSSYKRVSRKASVLRSEVYFTALKIVSYCLENQNTKDAVGILHNLVRLSEAQNKQEIPRHCEVVARIMDILVDVDPSATATVGQEQVQYFTEGICPFDGYFFWYYACALNSLGHSDEAYPLFRKCYELYKDRDGGDRWIALRARMYCSIMELRSSNTVDAEEFLWWFLRSAERNEFVHICTDDCETVAGQAAFHLLMYRVDQQNLHGLLPEILKFRDLCRKYDSSALYPLFKIRIAENFLSAYYLEEGDYLQAASSCMNALQTPVPDGTPVILDDDLLYSNLLLIYTSLNDIDRLLSLVEFLEGRLEDQQTRGYSYYTISCIIATAKKRLGYFSDDCLEVYRRELEQIYASVEKNSLPQLSKVGIPYLTWLLDMLETVTETSPVTAEEKLHYERILLYLRDHMPLKSNDRHRALIALRLAFLACLDKKAKTRQWLRECVSCGETIEIAREGSLRIFRVSAVMYYSLGDKQEALRLAEKVFSGTTAAWQKAVSILNDTRVCQILSTIQDNIRWCYSLCKVSYSPVDAYEKVLQFKNLAALVGKERNRVLRSGPTDTKLRDRIFALQNQLTTAELWDSHSGSNTTASILDSLIRLEAEFAARFPSHVQFADISYSNLTQVMPDNSAILEYYFSYSEKALDGRTRNEDTLVLDIFVLKKRNGKDHISHVTISGGTNLLDEAHKYTELLQESDDPRTDVERIQLNAALYRNLILPVLPHLQGVKTVYVAPDDDLCNIPFERLTADRKDTLTEHFQVIRILSGRDLLFTSSASQKAGDYFILGDPDYEGGDRDLNQSDRRKGTCGFETVSALPFSAVEVERISKRCSTKAITGIQATKFTLQKVNTCKIVHIATHGGFDLSASGNSLYSSCLLFAGYNRWVTKGREHHTFGNGILTADEISRMNLNSTELVVLSACQSALGDTDYNTVQGLLSAFSAAGAKWVICHLWKAHDLATAILMDAFYDAYINRRYPIPIALEWAKLSVRSTTFGDLRRNGWLESPDAMILFEDENNGIPLYKDNHKPFADEFFWGGVVAYQCRL